VKRKIREGLKECAEAEAELAFEPAVPQEMRIDNALVDSEAQARAENIFDLLPDEDGVDVADFHVFDPERKLTADS